MLGKSVQEIVVKSKDKREYVEKVKDWESANKIISALVEQDYVVMVSLEESLIVINYTYGDNLRSDRNDVMFMSLSDYEDMREEERKEMEEE